MGLAEGWACAGSDAPGVPLSTPRLPQSWPVCPEPSTAAAPMGRGCVSFLLVMHANQVDSKTKHNTQTETHRTTKPTNSKGEELGRPWTQSGPRCLRLPSVLSTLTPAPYSRNAACSKVEFSALRPPPGRGTAAFSCPGPLCEGMGAGWGAHRPGPPPSLTWPSQGAGEAFVGSWKFPWLGPGPAEALGQPPGFIFI